MNGEALAEAARQLVGAPFRLHGRDPATGLDCVGVLAASLSACGLPHSLPNGYTLRRRTPPETASWAAACGLRDAEGASAMGDVALMHISPCQFHLLIAAGAEGWVHAHAGVRRVVCGPPPPGASPIARWRLAETIED